MENIIRLKNVRKHRLERIEEEVNNALKHATNVSGNWETFTIDSDGDVGGDTSIAIDSNNKVHIRCILQTNEV